jgi:glutamate carboxypeptidase
MNLKSIRHLASASALCFVASPALAQLSPVEQQIVAAVQERSADALVLLERSVNINSGTMNHEGVREVGRLFRAEFDQLGFKTQWAEMPPAMQRAGHLLAQREGTKGKRLLLIGHLDTVFEKDSPVQMWNRSGDRVRGQGVSDMKGGDVIIIEALRALQKVGALDNTTISVVFSGDEERAGHPLEQSRADMVAAAKRSDIALAFEGTVVKNGMATGTVGRRASGGYTLEVTGKQGHSAGVFGNGSGYGAIYETARILNTFRDQLIEPDLTFNPGTILGGTDVSYNDPETRGTAYGKTNVISRSTRVESDMRYLSAEQRDKTYEKMRAIVAQSLPGTSAKITFYENYPPMAPTPGNYQLLELYSKASDDAGLGKVEAVPPGERGAGDIQFVAPLLDSLDGLGASGRGAHSPDEDLELKSIERAAIRTAILIYRLTR